MERFDDLKYSKEPFEGYKFRAKVEIQTGERDTTSFDVYTNSTDRVGTELELQSRRKYTIMPLKIIHWASKEQDEATSKFIEEVLQTI